MMFNTLETFTLMSYKMLGISIMFMAYVVLFFLMVGTMTVLESKTLSFLGLSEGPNLGIKGVTVFFLDFFKLMMKSGDISYLYFLSFLCVFTFFALFFILPFSSLGSSFPFGYLLFFISESVFSVFKCLFFSSFSNKFVQVASFSVKYITFTCDFFTILLFSPLLFLYSFFGLDSWEDIFSFFLLSDFLSFLPLMLMYFILLLLQVSSTPFDYFETESELVGGCSSELGGGPFILWSLIEYSEVLVKCSFFVFLFMPFLGSSSYSCFFMVILVFFVLMLSGVLPSFDYFSNIKFFMCKFFLVSNLVVLFYFFVVLFLYVF